MTQRDTPVRHIAVAALLVAIGNITSRLIGVIREAVLAATFGRGAELAAFTAASTIPTMVYDLLVSGAITAALVPVFSRIASHDDERDELLSRVLSLMLVIVSIIVAPLLLFAPLVVRIIAAGFDDTLQALTTTMIQWMLLAVPCMIIAGVMTAVLHARQQFVFPAFVTSVFNIGIIIATVLFAPIFGAVALALGMVLGALLQVGLQWYGLRQSRIQWRHDWNHPTIHEIIRLYAPVAIGMGFSAIGTLIDRRYASEYGATVLPTMRYATTLIQFPLGLVSTAVSAAILPALSRLQTIEQHEDFRTTVGTALTVVIALIVPASVVLWLVREPLTAIILQRNAFSADDTRAVATTIGYYLPGLPAAAVGQILLIACYARGSTLVPNIIQGGAIVAYVLAVQLAIPWFGRSAETLAFANSIQLIAHVVLMVILCHRLFDLRGLAITTTMIGCVIAAAVTWCMVQAALVVLPPVTGVLQLVLVAPVTGIVYVITAQLLGITPVRYATTLLWNRMRTMLGRVTVQP